MKEEMLRLDNVTRRINGDILLDDVNLYLMKGEIVGFIASEDKGKQELIDLLRQNLPIAYGRIYLNGRLVNSYAHSDYSYNKVYVIDQKGSLVPDLTVADNIFVMRRGFKKRIISRRVLARQVKRIFGQFNISVDPGQVVSRLKPLKRCLVELVRAQFMGCGLIILRDFNNFLSHEDIGAVCEIMEQFCRMGIAFLYIGNHHEDVFKICHRAVLFSGGQVQKVFMPGELDDAHIAPFIARFGIASRKRWSLGEEAVLEFQNVCCRHLKGLSFQVRAGECAALLDMDNNAIGDILGIMTGGAQAEKGKVLLKGGEYTRSIALQFLSRGVAVIEDDPVHSMIFRDLSCLENLTFLLDRKLGRSVIPEKYLKSVVGEYLPLIGGALLEPDVGMVEPEILYQLVYYRIHLYNPRVVLCVSPFACGDVRCRGLVLKLVQKLKNKGIAVLLLLVNISDSMEVADRLLVLKGGRISQEYMEDEFYLVKR